MQSPWNPLSEHYTELFYMIHERDVPSFQCKMSLRWSMTENSSWFSLYSHGTGRIENTASNNSSFVAWVFVTEEKCLPCRCLAMDIGSGSAVQAFIRHVTILASHIRVGMSSGLLSSGFRTKTLNAFLSFVLHAPPMTFSFIWSYK
jgi:hypothetical protein